MIILLPLLDTQTEKAMAPHSTTLAWKIPWAEEPGRLQSMGSLRVGHDWATSLSLFTFTFHFQALEKEMATHSSVLGWRIPGTAEPRVLPSMGSHRVGHDWSDLAAAAADTQDHSWIWCESWDQWNPPHRYPYLLVLSFLSSALPITPGFRSEHLSKAPPKHLK